VSYPVRRSRYIFFTKNIPLTTIRFLATCWVVRDVKVVDVDIWYKPTLFAYDTNSKYLLENKYSEIPSNDHPSIMTTCF